MTAIVYKDGVLAADRALFSGDHMVVGSVKKIAEFPNGWTCAVAGDYAQGVAIENMIASWPTRFDPTTLSIERFKEIGTECEGLVFGPRLSQNYVFDIIAGFDPLDQYQGCAAIGVADEFLYGCLRSGRSAIDTIRLAIEWTTTARGPIDHVVIRKSQKSKNRSKISAA